MRKEDNLSKLSLAIMFFLSKAIKHQRFFKILYQKVFLLECIGRGGVSQMLTKADEGGRGGQANADHC